MSERAQGKVIRARAGFVDVWVDDEIVQCRLRGRLKKERLRTDLCVAGDEVVISRSAGASWVVDDVLPRRTQFSRLHPGAGPPREDVLIANLDQILATFCFGTPVLNPRLLDRFAVIAEQQSLSTVIVVNKSDIADEETRQTLARYEELGYPVVETSTVTGAGLDELASHLVDRTSAFAGPSGVGKTSLSNALIPGLSERVAEVSAQHGKGRHITRVASIYRIPGGGFLADTPGIRELGTWQLAKESLDACFVEFRPYIGQCGFRQCSHSHEPNCAVIEAVEQTRIAPSRYDSYLRLLEETAAQPLSNR